MNAETPGSPNHEPKAPDGAKGEPYVPATNTQRDIQRNEMAQSSLDRHAAIEGFLIEHDCLQKMDWDHPDIPDRLVQELVKLETGFQIANPEFDLTTKSPSFVTKNAEIIWKKLQTQENEDRVSKDQAIAEMVAEKTEAEANSYADKIAALKSEGQSNIELVENLVGDP